jgi:hypothetical protein
VVRRYGPEGTGRRAAGVAVAAQPGRGAALRFAFLRLCFGKRDAEAFDDAGQVALVYPELKIQDDRTPVFRLHMDRHRNRTKLTRLYIQGETVVASQMRRSGKLLVQLGKLRPERRIVLDRFQN